MTDLGTLRAQILDAALDHVPFDGWTLTALWRGAADLGLDAADVGRAFPGGAIEALELFLSRADRRMVEALAEHDLDSLRVHERVTLAIRLRLEQNASYREAIRRGLSTLALPQNTALAVRSLYRTVNAIWYVAGDRSTDYNFYSKRLLLAAVYSSTVLCWLGDDSPGREATWAFLDRRIKDVGEVPKAIARVKKLADAVPDPFRLLRPRSARR
jgi:ubiquinone biosynthesis protein COQ9